MNTGNKKHNRIHNKILDLDWFCTCLFVVLLVCNCASVQLQVSNLNLFKLDICKLDTYRYVIHTSITCTWMGSLIFCCFPTVCKID